jgi:thioredoxin reductase
MNKHLVTVVAAGPAPVRAAGEATRAELGSVPARQRKPGQ